MASSSTRTLAIGGAIIVSLMLLGVACAVGGSGLQPAGPAPASTVVLAAPPALEAIDAATIAAGRSTAIGLPPQGLYESCLPHEPDCLLRLAEMGTRGFRIVLNDGLRYASSAAELRSYADRAGELGMQVILPVKYSPDWDTDNRHLVKRFAALASEGGAASNRGFLAYYVSILKDHPALWGYYMADEVHSEHHDALKTYADLVKSLDPHHPRLIVEEGTNDPMEVFFTFHSYMRDTADVVALDHYPYGYIDTYRSLSRYTGDSARMLQHWADRLGLKSAIVLQAFSWTQYRSVPLCMLWPACAPFPSYEQMKAQRDQALRHSRPEIILWFNYADILDSDDPAQHWSDLVAAAFAPPPAPVPLPTPRPQSCPPGWACEDIGHPVLEGSQSLSGNVWTIEGSGWDIASIMWKKADQFRYVWQPLAGDGGLSARVRGQTGSSAAAKAGIMLRKTFDPVSPFYAVYVTPGGDVGVQHRSAFGVDPVDVASRSEEAPVYLKISRAGTKYSALTSTDGSRWNLIPGSTVDAPALGGTLMAGLAVTSRDPAALSSAQFEDVVLYDEPGPRG